MKLFIVVEQIKNFSEYCKYISNKFTLPYEKWVMCIIFLYCVSEKSVFRFFSHTIHRCIVLRSVLVGTESINWGGGGRWGNIFFFKIPFLPTIYGLYSKMCSVQFSKILIAFLPTNIVSLYWKVLIAGTMPKNWEVRRRNILKCRFNLQNVLGHLQDFRKNENILLCNLFWKILNSIIDNTQFTPFCWIKRKNKKLRFNSFENLWKRYRPQFRNIRHTFGG